MKMSSVIIIRNVNWVLSFAFLSIHSNLVEEYHCERRTQKNRLAGSYISKTQQCETCSWSRCCSFADDWKKNALHYPQISQVVKEAPCREVRHQQSSKRSFRCNMVRKCIFSIERLWCSFWDDGTTFLLDETYLLAKVIHYVVSLTWDQV